MHHPKLKLLAADLGIDLCHARGVVESLWGVAKDRFIQGDVGRLSNEELLAAMDSSLDPDAVVAALVRRRFLDEVSPEQGRLYVHDWHEHAEDWVQMRLARARMVFANGASPRNSRLSRQQRAGAGVANPPTEEAEHSVRTVSAQCAHAERTPSALCAHLTLEPKYPSTKLPREVTSSGNRESVVTAPPPDGSGRKRSGAEGTRLPAEFDLSTARIEMARKEGLSDAATRSEFASFCDYWRATPGARGRKCDWDATWRNWCRRVERSWPGPRASGVAANNQAAVAEAIQRNEARQAGLIPVPAAGLSFADATRMALEKREPRLVGVSRG